MLTNATQNDTKKPSALRNVSLVALFSFTALSGILPQWMLSLGVVVCFGMLLLCNSLYLGFPFVIFYNSVYGLVFGMSVLRIYTLLMLLHILLKMTSSISFKTKYILPLSVYTLFLILVMMPNNLREGFFLLFDVVCCLTIVTDISDDSDAFNLFFKTYSIVCLCSYLTGILIGNTIGGEYNYSRFNATFEDPNYMGFFFTIAIFSILCLKLFDKRLRYIIIIVLYAMMMSSLSITAIVVNIILWLFYLFMMKKLKPAGLIIIIAVFVLLSALYSYGVENPDIPVLGDLSARIDEKVQSFISGDIDEVTTGRTSLTKENLEYYLSLPMFNVFFGGIPVNPRNIHPDIKAVSHNEYVDLLLNVGIIGAIVMLGFFLFSYWSSIKRYRLANKEHDLCIVMLKTTWLLYAFALTMFLDFRFMLLFLI